MYGAAFGVGYYVAMFLIDHPWSSELVNFAKDEAVQKAARRGLKETATATAGQSNEIGQVVVK